MIQAQLQQQNKGIRDTITAKAICDTNIFNSADERHSIDLAKT